MSRSRRKNPVCGFTICSSEKEDKRIYNRRYRRVARHAVREWDESKPFPKLQELSDPWSMGKDGKMRFDPYKHGDLMRK